ncbi:MAG: hypothetical protein A2V93_05240 [Ignavibacteria bacterium RBG_16_34_14]|nr:MAG: hypothetical protein A2V93_05240 [Ignavibacteria bacterium RBG_16_34_14]
MDADKLIVEIDHFSNHKLKRKSDLGILIEVIIKNGREKLFEDLTFNAKYVLGLQRVLKKGNASSEIGNLEKIKEDYTNNLIKSIEQIKELMNFTSEEMQNHFNETYFELSHQSLQNLNELLEDLEWTKMFLNQLKRTNPIS